MSVGKRIREIRKTQKMKLVELARKSGVQIATLSRIEHGKMTGTLDSHIAVAKALGVDITDLYKNISKQNTSVDVHKADDEVKDVFLHSQSAKNEILTTRILKKQMLPSLLTLEPGGSTPLEQNKIGSEKFIYVIEGSILIHIDKKAYDLKANGSLYFDSSLEHYIENKAGQTAKALVVVTPVNL